MNASSRLTATRETAVATEMSAWSSEYFCREIERIAPEDDATVRVTIGSSHVVVIVSNECFWVVDLCLSILDSSTLGRMAHIICSNPQQHRADMAMSAHQTAQRKYRKGLPPNP